MERNIKILNKSNKKIPVATNVTTDVNKNISNAVAANASIIIILHPKNKVTHLKDHIFLRTTSFYSNEAVDECCRYHFLNKTVPSVILILTYPTENLHNRMLIFVSIIKMSLGMHLEYSV